MTPFLFLSALALAPQAVAPAAATESSDREVVAAMKAFAAASDEGAAAQAEIAPLMRKALGSLRSEKDALAASAEIRPLIARFRTRLVRSGAAIAAIRPVVFPSDVPFTFDRLRDDFLDQNRATVRLLDGVDGVLVAALAGNRADLERHLAEVTQGAVTLVTAQATILRGRQAAVPTDESTHQSIGLLADLYDAMAVVAGVRTNARFEGEQPVARLERLTASTRSLSAAGRANLAREQAAVGNAPQGATERAVLAAEAEAFALGDDMAATFTEMSSAALTVERAAAFQARLTDLETRFHRITARQLAAVPTP